MKHYSIKQQISFILTVTVLLSYGFTVFADDEDNIGDSPALAEDTVGSEETLPEEEPISEEINVPEEEPEAEPAIEAGQDEEPVEVTDLDEEEVLAFNGKDRGDDGYYYYYVHGTIKTGWIMYDTSHYYYAGSDGRLYQNKWLKSGGKWYYFDNECIMAAGKIQSIYDPKTYTYSYSAYFDDSGALQTGWIKYNSAGDYLYADSSGKLATGWKEIKSKWYYFDSSFKMRTGRFSVYDEATNTYLYYYSNDNGVMQTGWIKYNKNYYYYADSSGVLAEGWKKISGKWYYFNDNNTMQTGQITLSGFTYYLKDGAMQTGWFQKDSYSYSSWYYADSNGHMLKGWQKINKKWYYFSEETYNTYAMVTGIQTIGNYTYYLKDGVMQTGWFQSYDSWYYAESNGHLYQNKWLKSGGKWYYFDSYGEMVTSYKRTIDGKVYYFNSDGSCQNP